MPILLPLTATPILSAYNPHEAENGKFIALDSNTLDGYGVLSGSGRYAVLTYNLNGNGSGGGGGTTVASSISVSNIVPVQGFSGMTPLSVVSVNPGSSGSTTITNTLCVQGFTNMVPLSVSTTNSSLSVSSLVNVQGYTGMVPLSTTVLNPVVQGFTGMVPLSTTVLNPVVQGFTGMIPLSVSTALVQGFAGMAPVSAAIQGFTGMTALSVRVSNPVLVQGFAGMAPVSANVQGFVGMAPLSSNISNTVNVQGFANMAPLSVAGNITSTFTTGSAAGLTLTASNAYENARVFKQQGGTLFSLIGYSTRSTPQFIQIFNTAYIPADNAVPTVTYFVGPSANFDLEISQTLGIPLSGGITVCNSLVAPVKVIGSADCFFTAVFR